MPIMHKATLLIAALALAATCSVADAKKKARHHAPAKPVAAKQEMPGEPGARVVAGYFRELGKIGQPVQPAKKKK
jgi:hypothetical protein